jgi:hypothetical protein
MEPFGGIEKVMRRGNMLTDVQQILGLEIITLFGSLAAQWVEMAITYGNGLVPDGKHLVMQAWR